MNEQLKQVYQEAARERRSLEKACALADEISSFLNCENMGFLMEAMSRQHRTLQQRFTAFALQWLFYLSRLDSADYDLRNEASVRVAKQVAEALDWQDVKPTLPNI